MDCQCHYVSKVSHIFLKRININIYKDSKFHDFFMIFEFFHDNIRLGMAIYDLEKKSWSFSVLLKFLKICLHFCPLQ